MTGFATHTVLHLLANDLWEELVRSGFVTTQLQARHSPMVAALLTAPPFALQHSPLVFDSPKAPSSWPRSSSWPDRHRQRQTSCLSGRRGPAVPAADRHGPRVRRDDLRDAAAPSEAHPAQLLRPGGCRGRSSLTDRP